MKTSEKTLPTTLIIIASFLLTYGVYCLIVGNTTQALFHIIINSVAIIFNILTLRLINIK